MKIQVFDPPMCCSTGVCDPSADPELVRFAAALDWLKRQGVEVERRVRPRSLLLDSRPVIAHGRHPGWCVRRRSRPRSCPPRRRAGL